MQSEVKLTRAEVKPTSRDPFIDITRGICTLSIVFIHTTFYSGISYVPTYVQTISLLLDVPAFFFLSGMVFAVTKKDNIISGIFRLSTTFGLLAFLYDLAFSNFNFNNTLLALTLNAPKLNRFIVVEGSYWFITIYVVVSIFGVVILKKIEKIYIPLMIALFTYYPLDFFLDIERLEQLSVLGVNINFLLFYLFMYLFGYFVQRRIINWEFKNQFSLALSAMGLILCLMAYYKNGDSSLLVLQESKFPTVELPYASASLFSIAAIIYFHNDSLKIKWLEHIGKNAIFYYAGQGIGASILFEFVSKFDFEFWPLKLLLMFSINLFTTMIVSEGLRCIYKFLETLCSPKSWAKNVRL